MNNELYSIQFYFIDLLVYVYFLYLSFIENLNYCK